MANILSYGGRIIGGGASSSSGGHTIVDSAGTELAQQPNLKFKGGLKATNNTTNSSTEIDDSPTRITWTDWNLLTPQEQAAIPKALITNVPGCDVSIRADLMTTLWTNPDPTTAFAGQNITLSSADYDFLLVIFNPSLDISNYLRSSTIIPKGAHTILSYSVANSNTVGCYNRWMTYASNTTYTIDTGYVVNSGGTRFEWTTACIPLVIYGIKNSIEFDFSAIASDVSTSADKCMMSDGVTTVNTAVTNLYQYGLNYRDTTDDCNTAVTPGFYAINQNASNMPSSEFEYGVLVTLGGYHPYQIAISSYEPFKFAIRYIGFGWRII